jgi:chromatin modification-related protein YNG2
VLLIHYFARCSEMLPKLAAREAQLKELLMRKEVLTDFDKAKVEKLNEKIKVDYARADEWSSQKETLSKELWRCIVAHQRRLEQEMNKISPALIKQVENTLPAHSYLSSATSLSSLSVSNSLSGISTILANLKSPSVEVDSLHGTSNGGSSHKRKHGSALARESPSHSTKQSRHPSTDRTSSPALTIPTNAFIPPASYPVISKKALKNSGLSSMLAKVESSNDADGDFDADGDLDGSNDADKDTKLYCHCQRVSFGEVR